MGLVFYCVIISVFKSMPILSGPQEDTTVTIVCQWCEFPYLALPVELLAFIWHIV